MYCAYSFTKTEMGLIIILHRRFQLTDLWTGTHKCMQYGLWMEALLLTYGEQYWSDNNRNQTRSVSGFLFCSKKYFPVKSKNVSVCLKAWIVCKGIQYVSPHCLILMFRSSTGSSYPKFINSPKSIFVRIMATRAVERQGYTWNFKIFTSPIMENPITPYHTRTHHTTMAGRLGAAMILRHSKFEQQDCPRGKVITFENYTINPLPYGTQHLHTCTANNLKKSKKHRTNMMPANAQRINEQSK